MKIGVLSDTHLTFPAPPLEYTLEELFRADDLILHAGDIVSRKVLRRLEEKGVLAVSGNMDDSEVVEPCLKENYSGCGIRIELIHGWGGRQGLRERLLARLKPDNPDIIILWTFTRCLLGRSEWHNDVQSGRRCSQPLRRGGSVGRIEIC